MPFPFVRDGQRRSVALSSGIGNLLALVFSIVMAIIVVQYASNTTNFKLGHDRNMPQCGSYCLF